MKQNNQNNGNGKPTTNNKKKPLSMKKALQRVTQQYKSRQQNENENYSKGLFETPYLTALLEPESACSAKIPGQAVPVVSIHRKQVFRFLTNANGNFSLRYVVDGQVVDNTVAFLPIWITNGALYDGTAVVAGVQQAYINPYNIPAGNVRNYRVISSSILVRSLASALNRTGDIHIAMVNGGVGSNPGGETADMQNYMILTNITSLGQGKYAQAHLEKGLCGRAIWIPQDLTCLDFKIINAAFGLTDNFVSVIGLGLAPTSTVEVEININIEVTPLPGSILTGMEQICMHNTDPLKTWRNILTQHAVCTTPIDNGCSSNATATQSMLTGTIINGKYYKNSDFTTDVREAQITGKIFRPSNFELSK